MAMTKRGEWRERDYRQAEWEINNKIRYSVVWMCSIKISNSAFNTINSCDGFDLCLGSGITPCFVWITSRNREQSGWAFERYEILNENENESLWTFHSLRWNLFAPPSNRWVTFSSLRTKHTSSDSIQEQNGWNTKTKRITDEDHNTSTDASAKGLLQDEKKLRCFFMLLMQ